MAIIGTCVVCLRTISDQESSVSWTIDMRFHSQCERRMPTDYTPREWVARKHMSFAAWLKWRDEDNRYQRGEE